MKSNSKVKIEISGHTDSKGSAEYNQKLSENRAKTVVDYLVKASIATDRLTFKGYGKEQDIIFGKYGTVGRSVGIFFCECFTIFCFLLNS